MIVVSFFCFASSAKKDPRRRIARTAATARLYFVFYMAKADGKEEFAECGVNFDESQLGASYEGRSHVGRQVGQDGQQTCRC